MWGKTLYRIAMITYEQGYKQEVKPPNICSSVMLREIDFEVPYIIFTNPTHKHSCIQIYKLKKFN